MGHLTSLSPQKDPFIQKGPSWTYKKKHMVLFFLAQRLFMHLLQNCRARRNRTPLRSCSVKTRTYFERVPGARGERRGRFLRVIYFEQMISSLARMDCNIESITGCCCRGAVVWVAVEQDGERRTRERITTALQLRTLGLIQVFYKSFAIHLGCSFIKGNNQKGLKGIVCLN